MYKLMTVFLPLLVAVAGSYAQCDQKVVISGSKTEYLKADSSVQRTVDEHTDIEFDKTTIKITAGDDHIMNGTIRSYDCNWQTPFKEGKSVLKITITEEDGKAHNITLTIKGKDGKINFLVEVDEDANKKIRLTVDKFEAKAG